MTKSKKAESPPRTVDTPPAPRHERDRVWYRRLADIKGRRSAHDRWHVFEMDSPSGARDVKRRIQKGTTPTPEPDTGCAWEITTRSHTPTDGKSSVYVKYVTK